MLPTAAANMPAGPLEDELQQLRRSSNPPPAVELLFRRQQQLREEEEAAEEEAAEGSSTEPLNDYGGPTNRPPTRLSKADKLAVEMSVEVDKRGSEFALLAMEDREERVRERPPSTRGQRENKNAIGGLKAMFETNTASDGLPKLLDLPRQLPCSPRSQRPPEKPEATPLSSNAVAEAASAGVAVEAAQPSVLPPWLMLVVSGLCLVLLLAASAAGEWAVGVAVYRGKPKLARVGLTAVNFEHGALEGAVAAASPPPEEELVPLRALCAHREAPLPANLLDLIPETPPQVWCEFERAGARATALLAAAWLPALAAVAAAAVAALGVRLRLAVPLVAQPAAAALRAAVAGCWAKVEAKVPLAWRGVAAWRGAAAWCQARRSGERGGLKASVGLLALWAVLWALLLISVLDFARLAPLTDVPCTSSWRAQLSHWRLVESGYCPW